MQTTANTGLAQVDRITLAAHQTNQRVAMPSVIAYDYRLRGFARANAGAYTFNDSFDVVMNANGELVRARCAVSGNLEIVYATPSASMTWSANTIGATPALHVCALNGAGTNALEVYWLHSDYKTLYRATSSDGGHTWSAGAVVTTLATEQYELQMSSPAANLLFFTDDASDGAWVKVGLYSAGAWTISKWDFTNLKTNPILDEFTDAPVRVPGLATQSLGNNEYLLAFYAQAPRGHQNAGIYTVRVSNLVAGQTPHWHQIEPLFTTNPGLSTVGGVTYPTLYLAFPRLQRVGSEYWLTALEASGYAGHDVRHLCFLRSTDGIHWTTRQYLAGTDLTYTVSGTPTAFALMDLQNAKVFVSGTRFLICAYDQVFITTATPLCGVTDATNLLPNGSFEGTFSSGIAPSWSAYANGSGAGTRAESADAYAGNKAQRITKTDGGADRFGVTSNTAAVGVSPFDLSVRIKVLSYVAGAKIYLYTDFSGGPYAQGQLYTIQATDVNQWIRLSFNGAISDSTDLCFFYVWVQDANADILIDDARIAPATGKSLDLSAYVVPPSSITESGAGQSAVVSLTVENPNGIFNGSTILRRGAVIEIALGYYTSAAADETMPTIKLLVDEIRQASSLGDDRIENRLQIQARNLIKLMQDDADKPDIFYSYDAPEHTQLTQINDLTALNVFNGAFVADGQLTGGLIMVGSSLVDNLAALAHLRGEDGFVELRFKSVPGGAWTNSYVGVALQMQDQQHYYAVLFNYANDSKTFGLYQASPGSSGKVVAYALVPSVGGETRTTTLGSALAINTEYYLLVGQWHNRVKAFYSTDRINWTKVIDYAPIASEISYFGVIQKGNVTASTAFGEAHQPAELLGWNAMLNDMNTANPGGLYGKRVRYFVRVKTRQAGVLRSIGLAVLRSVVGVPPSAVLKVWKDNGAGTDPADLTNAANLLYAYTFGSYDFPVQQTNSYAPWTVHAVTTLVNLDAETYYWISLESASDISIDGSGSLTQAVLGLRYMPASHNGDGQGLKCRYQYDLTAPANFYDFQPANGGLGSTLSMYLKTSYDASGIEILGLHHSGGEMPRPIEWIANDLCVKAGITAWSPDTWLDDTLATFSNGADGSAYTFANNYTGVWAIGGGQLQAYHAALSSWAFLRSNTYYGARGDGFYEVDLTILAASKRAGILWRAAGAPSAFTSAYLIDVSTATLPLITWSKIVAGTLTTLRVMPSLVPIPTNAQFKLNVLANAGAISVYVNECLAGMFWEDGDGFVPITAQGEIGLAVLGNNSGGAVAKFANLRVPDVWKIKGTFDVAENMSWQSALNNLIGKDRVNYFVRASGAMRLASFTRRAVVDTYDSTIVQCVKTDSDRYWASHIRPEGDRFADRFEPVLLDSDGRRFRKEDYTDAYTDEQAYDDAAVPLRAARERTAQYEMTSVAVPAMELEDVIALTNPLDGTSAGQYIVNDRTLTFNLTEDAGDELVFSQVVGLRAFVG
jgi:hypothetical protein